MEEHSKKTQWRSILTVITIAALLILILILRNQIISTIKNLHKVDLFVLSLLIPIEFCNYYAQAKLYQSSLENLGHKLKLKFLFTFSLELNFISTIFPSGGISGVSYTSLRLKSKDISTAQATLTQVLKTVIVFSSFLFLLIIGLICLAVSGHTSNVLILVAATIVTTLVILTLIGIYIIGDNQRINETLTYITKLLNRIIHLFRPKVREAINIDRARETFSELHVSYLAFRHNLKALKRPIIWGLIANTTEILALYVVYVAFGHWENPGGIIIAYALANFASVISILPGGLGAYEAIMTLVLAASGISPSLSLPVTIMYRVINTLIQIIPGYIYYQQAIKPRKLIDAE